MRLQRDYRVASCSQMIPQWQFTHHELQGITRIFRLLLKPRSPYSILHFDFNA
jgi:hypothetical protein